MLRPISQITFTKADRKTQYIFDFINEFSTNESFENLTDKFMIKFPLNLKLEGQPIVDGNDSIFNRGDEVKVEAGYYPNLDVIFEGHVVNVSAKTPIEITCEDDMYLLKNTNVTYPSKRRVQNYSIKKNGTLGKRLKRPKIITSSVTLEQLMDNIMPDNVDYESNFEVNLGKFVVTNASVTKVLEVLRQKYGIYAYFRDHVLRVGFARNSEDSTTYQFFFEKKVNGIISDGDLEYQLAKDIPLKVVAKMIGLNSTWEEVTVGDTDGAQRTYHLFWDGKGAKPSLKEFAELKLNEDKYDGWRGSFETFGEPAVKHGDIAELNSDRFPERNGSYVIKGVERILSADRGYKQIIHLGEKVNG